MTAVQLVLESGEYFPETLPWDINFSTALDNNAFGCKQFLLSILLRALLDATMYPENDERAISAKKWLSGEVESLISPSEILDLVGYSCLGSVLNKFISEEDSPYKEVIRQMKGHLYSRGGLN